jgi:hypothetical protein
MTRLPLPPPAGIVEGLAVAATAHRTGVGVTLVLLEVEPHAAAVTAMSVTSARCLVCERW